LFLHEWIRIEVDLDRAFLILKQIQRAEFDSTLAALGFFFRLDQSIKNFAHFALADRFNDVLL
jgi:hypothetical protein